MKPLSEADANEIFNTAVEAASELDYEAMAQIRLLDKLVSRGGRPLSRMPEAQPGRSATSSRIRRSGLKDTTTSLGTERWLLWHALGCSSRACQRSTMGRRGTHSTSRDPGTRAQNGHGQRGPSNPGRWRPLTMLADDGGDVIAEILKRSRDAECSNLPTLVEEAAYDVLVRNAHRGRREVMRYVEQHGPTGPWSDSLLRQERFLASLPPEAAADEEGAHDPDTEADTPPVAHVWDRETLRDSSLLQEAVRELWERMRDERAMHRRSTIFESARRAVSPADRAAHLTALAGLDEHALTGVAVEAILHAIDEWRTSPSVQGWCRTELPAVIVARFPDMTRYLEYGEDNLTRALERTGLADPEVQDVLLRALEHHVDGIGSEMLFAIAGMIGRRLAQRDAANLADWYAERLEKRISPEYRDQTAPDSALPREVDEAVARFLFACMGDCDLRLRWRAAHAVRRLARTGEVATLAALIAEYHRREESVFRGRDLDFYWLAARLWFVLVWDRVAVERPELAARAGPTLLEIALDDSFPHLLVRSFARDACKKLAAAGHLSLGSEQHSHLVRVNESPVPRAPANPGVRKSIGLGHRDGFAYSNGDRRFKFDPIDTLPYWYAPMLQSFAAVDGERFLREAERWIVDAWGHRGDADGFVKESRRGRFDRNDWRLSMHSHGSRPTVETLRTHLEWHAMWCAAGELLKTEPLVPRSEDNWHELSDRVDGEKLVEPPLWSSDLLVSTPLLARNWRSDNRPIDDWMLGVQETDYRAEVFPNDSPCCVIVDGSSEHRTRDRLERTHVSSALVEPTTSRSLLRALQTTSDSWSYKLPDEGEEHAEIDEAPYRLLGWLQRSHRDDGIDRKEPFRGNAFRIDCRPGRRVEVACNLMRDATGRPRWSNPDAAQPMFVYQAWGAAENDDERYQRDFAVAGQRLLAHREQLLNFLRGQELDLIVEVQVTRRERKTRPYSGGNWESTPERRCARLYLFDGQGSLEVAEGYLGTWTGDSQAA